MNRDSSKAEIIIAIYQARVIGFRPAYISYKLGRTMS